jgi:hypothetical protein
MNIPPELIAAVIGALVTILASVVSRTILAKRSDKIVLSRGHDSRTIEVSGYPTPDEVEQRLRALATIAPDAAVLEAWRIVERLAQQVASKGQLADEVKRKPADQLLFAAHVLDAEQASRFSRLREARNIVAHGGQRVELPMDEIITDIRRLAAMQSALS